MNKHTPGPWAVVDNGIWDVSVVGEATICHINNKGEWFPKDGTQMGRSQNKMLADARLIAAAPDLLEALKEVYDWCYPTDSAWAIKARAAIAKATGEN